MKLNAPPATWRQIQRTNFTQLAAICDFLELPPAAREQLLGSPRFEINIPRRLAQKMQKGTLEDPIARQFLPLIDENKHAAGFDSQPIQDPLFRLSPRLIQKYTQRSLLITTGACAMHCRYCFRQNYDYRQAPIGYEADLEHLRKDEGIEEVILSGGDPLSLSNDTLFALIRSIEQLTHIQRLRIHTRFPIGIPERLDPHFLQQMRLLRKPLWVVLHINHPRELDDDVLKALAQWRAQGAILLNQSVLLKGVNDDLPTLEQLCRTLVNHSIMPYYLHCLDRVQGAAHYDVDPQRGIELIEQLRTRLCGYAIPQLVREVPGEPSKQPVHKTLHSVY